MNIHRVILLSIIILLVSCTERWEKKEQLGVFVKTEYWERNNLDWEGGNTNVRKTTLCSKEKDLCFEDKHIHIIDSPGRAIKIRDPSDNKTYLYNKYTGLPIECLNCKPKIVFSKVLDSSFTWYKNGSRAVATDTFPFMSAKNKEQYNAQKHTIWLLTLLPEGVEVQEISPAGDSYHFGEPQNLSISPSEESVAWHLCDSVCSLWQYNFAQETYSQTKTPCDYKQFNSYWEISWKSGKAVTELYWGGRTQEMCFNEDGSAAFPKQESNNWGQQ